MSKRYLRLHESHIYPFMSLFTLEAIIVFEHGEPLGHHHPGSRALLSLVRFWRTRKSLCMNRVKSLLSLRYMLLAVLIPGLQIAALGTAGSVMTSGLSLNGCSHSKNQFEERKQDWLVQKFMLRWLQRLDAIQAETLFFPLSQETKRRLCLQGGVGHHWYSSPFNGVSTASSSPKSIGSFSNDDGDGNKDVKKAIGLLRKTTTLHVHHAFLYISLPSLHDYDVKMPNCKFNGGRKQATTNLLFSL